MFYDNQINNNNDNNNRIVIMYIFLTIKDIINLKFQNRIVINNRLYYLLKVEYDPTKKSSSKVTLQKQSINLDNDGVFKYSNLKNNNTDHFNINNDGDYIITD
jgi:outer membrane lipoprotein-sorting protein